MLTPLSLAYRRPVFTRVDHVGIAVADLDEAIAWYARTFDMHCVHQEVNEEQVVEEFKQFLDEVKPEDFSAEADPD